VHAADVNVNVELVRRGAAAPYFRSGDEGIYAEVLLEAVEDARRERRGMWGSCRVSWQPDSAVTTRSR
jgi:endonuclease YncB( thermonuclease family)